MFTSLLFLVALFFSPLAAMISGIFEFEGLSLRPVIAPPLIVVGFLMMKCVSQIKWDDFTEAVPAFLAIVVMPLTLNITEGIAFGFISYTLLKLVSGKGKEVHWIIYFFAGLFVLRYIIS
jgi:AGZA family xanthine/uracil permease-like MFS transporter